MTFAAVAGRALHSSQTNEHTPTSNCSASFCFWKVSSMRFCRSCSALRTCTVHEQSSQGLGEAGAACKNTPGEQAARTSSLQRTSCLPNHNTPQAYSPPCLPMPQRCKGSSKGSELVLLRPPQCSCSPFPTPAPSMKQTDKSTHHAVHVKVSAACTCAAARCVVHACGDHLVDHLELVFQHLRLHPAEVAACLAEVYSTQ